MFFYSKILTVHCAVYFTCFLHDTIALAPYLDWIKRHNGRWPLWPTLVRREFSILSPNSIYRSNSGPFPIEAFRYRYAQLLRFFHFRHRCLHFRYKEPHCVGRELLCPKSPNWAKFDSNRPLDLSMNFQLDLACLPRAWFFLWK